jgi:hypothetical protein
VTENIPIIELILKLLTGPLKWNKSRHSKKQYKAHLAAVVAEVLKLDPDINAARANLLAAEALGEPPSKDFLDAAEMLRKVELLPRDVGICAVESAKGKPTRRKAMKKKATKKRTFQKRGRAVKKKATKRTAKKKQVKRRMGR